MRSSSFLFASFLAVAACGGSVSTSDGTGEPSSSGASSTSGGGSKSGKGSGGASSSSSSDGSNCHYPEIINPVGCPPAYTRFGLGRCEPVGLKCWYPGVGDGTSDGCWSTALLACVEDDETDGGADGGAGTGSWRAAQ